MNTKNSSVNTLDLGVAIRNPSRTIASLGSIMNKNHTIKILEILKERGEKGVHSFELIKLVSPRCSARILDLKNQGYSITSVFEKMNGSLGVRYFLQESPSQDKKNNQNRPFKWVFEGNVARREYI